MRDTKRVMIWFDLSCFWPRGSSLPAVALGFAPRGFRVMIFVLSLSFGFGIGAVVELGGPDSPGLLLPFFGFAVAVGTLVAELTAFLIESAKRRYRTRSRFTGD